MGKAAIENLRENQQQVDMEGIMIGVSRQALDEALDYIADLENKLAAAERDAGRLDWLVEMIEEHGGVRLHNGNFSGGHIGLGLANTGRNLRTAIDEARGEG